MERYIRTTLNFTLLMPMIVAWFLLIHKYYGKDFQNLFINSPLLFSEARVVMNLPVKAVVPIANQTDKTMAESETPQDTFSQQMAREQGHLKQIAEFDQSKSRTTEKSAGADLPQDLPAKNIESPVLQTGETNANVEAAPDYDETLVEVPDIAKNAKPLVSKYVNTVFNKNIMRSFKVSGHKAVAFKADSLLANGPKGIVISKSNLKFLEASFARFKDLYGIAKVVVVAPEDHNPSYTQKISKFAKNYFAFDLQITSEYEFEDGFEIILIGAHL